MSEERDRLERALAACDTGSWEFMPARMSDVRAVLSALEAAEKRIAELERRVAKQDGLIPALKADSKQMNVNAVAYQAERKRAERAEAENAALRTERDAKAKECLEWSERSGHFMRKYDEARAERDRLREALEKIVTVGNALIATKPATMTEKFMALDIVDRTARAALASGEESR